MSYTILYRRVAVKMPSGRYLVLVEAGDNNVYDTDSITGREKRSRSWEADTFGGSSPFVTRADVEAWLQRQADKAADAAMVDLCEDTDPRHTDWKRHFGWYRSLALGGQKPVSTTYGAVRAFFLKALDRAVDLDTFLRFAHSFNINYHIKDCNWGAERGFTTEEALEEAFIRISANKDGTWIVPESKYFTGIIADMTANSPSVHGFVVSVILGNEAKAYPQFIATLLPLKLTDNKTQAIRLPKRCIDNNALWRFVDRISGGHLKQMSWEKI